MLAVVSFGAVAAVVGWVAIISGQSSSRQVIVTAVRAQYTFADLMKQAEVVALIEPTGSVNVHWNSADNAEWASEEIGTRSHIYRDEVVQVAKVLVGDLSSDMLTIRGVGGTVGDVTIDYEQQPVFARGQRYLAFLEQADTPTREGFERAWTLVWLGHGLFTWRSDGLWVNPIGITVTEAELGAP